VLNFDPSTPKNAEKQLSVLEKLLLGLGHDVELAAIAISNQFHTVVDGKLLPWQSCWLARGQFIFCLYGV
jgi:hypothetical protein